MEKSDKPFEVVGVNVGQPPDKRKMWPDGKTSAEKFQNLRAELWWLLRDRLEKTYEHVLALEGDFDQGASIRSTNCWRCPTTRRWRHS